jgi:surface protein
LKILPAMPRFRNVRAHAAGTGGVIDLASIMVGVIIVGILSAGITATVFALVPWAQDNSAKQSLGAVASAESSQMSINGSAMAYDNHPDSEYRLLEVSDPGISVSTSRLVIETGDDGQSWLAAIRSATGNVFLRSNASPEVFEAESLGYTMASAGGYAGGVQTFAIPTGLTLPTGVDTTKVQQIVTNVSAQSLYDFGSEKLGFGEGLPDATAAAPADPTSIMEFTINSAGDCTEYNIPVYGVSVDGVTIDWGDGSEPELTTADYATHTYADGGVKELTVDGVFTSFGTDASAYEAYMGEGGHTECTTAVTQWDDNTGTTDLTAAFRDSALTELVGIPSGVTDMTDMFKGTTVFNQSLGDSFDTSSVTDMTGMFDGTDAFNSSLGSNFDTANVTDMTNMFANTTVFDQPLGDKFDTSSVTDMSSWLRLALAFDQPLGDKFDTSSVTDMNNMFAYTDFFDQPLGDLFDTSSVTDMSYMFSGGVFNQSLGDKFDTSSVTDMNDMFRYSYDFNQPLGVLFDTSNVTDMEFMFQHAIAFNQPLGVNFDTNKVVDMDRMFEGALVFNQPFGANFGTGLVGDMYQMFHDAAAFNQDISGWDVANVTTWNRFRDGSALTTAHTPAAFR